MAREFLARLIDIDCDFSLHDLENRRATPGSPSYRKIGFPFCRRLFIMEALSVNLRERSACVKSKSRVSL